MQAAGRSTGAELKRRRLLRRAERIRHALEAMRQLAPGRPGAPPPLRHGMSDFGRELERVERRLRELDRGPSATAPRSSNVWPRRERPGAPA
jgi:hypothetical protein